MGGGLGLLSHGSSLGTLALGFRQRIIFALLNRASDQRGSDEGRGDHHNDGDGERFLVQYTVALAQVGEDQSDLATRDHPETDEGLVGPLASREPASVLAQEGDDGEATSQQQHLRILEDPQVHGHARDDEEERHEEHGDSINQLLHMCLTRMARDLQQALLGTLAFNDLRCFLHILGELRLLELLEVHRIQDQPSGERTHDRLQACQYLGTVGVDRTEGQRERHLHLRSGVQTAETLADRRR